MESIKTTRYITDELAPWRALTAAVIIQALKDARKGRACGPACHRYGHNCAEEALRFLHSSECAGLVAALNLSPDAITSVIARLDELDLVDQQRSPRYDRRRLKAAPRRGKPGYKTYRGRWLITD